MRGQEHGGLPPKRHRAARRHSAGLTFHRYLPLALPALTSDGRHYTSWSSPSTPTRAEEPRRSDVEEPGHLSTRLTRALGDPGVGTLGRPTGRGRRERGRPSAATQDGQPARGLAKRLVVPCAAGELEISDVFTDAVECALERG